MSFKTKHAYDKHIHGGNWNCFNTSVEILFLT